jgi:hypothetical protein
MLHNRLQSDPRGAKVLFVVVKCEKYLRRVGAQRVYDAVRKGYGSLFAQINASPQSSADICLVETLGSIELDQLEIVATTTGQEYPRYHFKKISEGATHSPRNTALPLKLILDSAIETSMAERRAAYDGINWLRDLAGRDDDLKSLLSHMRDLAARASSESAHLAVKR